MQQDRCRQTATAFPGQPEDQRWQKYGGGPQGRVTEKVQGSEYPAGDKVRMGQWTQSPGMKFCLDRFLQPAAKDDFLGNRVE